MKKKGTFVSLFMALILFIFSERTVFAAEAINEIVAPTGVKAFLVLIPLVLVLVLLFKKVDMIIAGLIAGDVAKNPLDYGFHVLTTTTHKTLRGPRGGMILCKEEFAKAIRVSRQTVSSIENGRYNPSLDLAFIISDFFEKPIEDIFIHERKRKNEK